MNQNINDVLSLILDFSDFLCHWNIEMDKTPLDLATLLCLAYFYRIFTVIKNKGIIFLAYVIFVCFGANRLRHQFPKQQKAFSMYDSVSQK